MSIIVAAITIVTIIAISLWLVQHDLKQKVKLMKQLLEKFSQVGIDYHLNYSCQQLLSHAVIGVDGVQRKLVVISKQYQKVDALILDLSDVRECYVNKDYGADRRKWGSASPERVLLNVLLNGRPPLEFVFYDHTIHCDNEYEDLEIKARHWETILLKLNAPVKYTA